MKKSETIDTEKCPQETILLDLKDIDSYLPKLEEMMKKFDELYQEYSGFGIKKEQYDLFKQRMDVALEYAYVLKQKEEQGAMPSEEFQDIIEKMYPLIAMFAISESINNASQEEEKPQVIN